MPTRPNWSRVVQAWARRAAARRGQGAATAVVAAAALGAAGCAGLETPSAAGGRDTASRSLSPEQLREVAATFEAQGRADTAQMLFAAADRRSGAVPAGPADLPGAGRPPAPPSPAPPAPVRLAGSERPRPEPEGPPAPAAPRDEPVAAELVAAELVAAELVAAELVAAELVAAELVAADQEPPVGPEESAAGGDAASAAEIAAAVPEPGAPATGDDPAPAAGGVKPAAPREPIFLSELTPFPGGPTPFGPGSSVEPAVPAAAVEFAPAKVRRLSEATMSAGFDPPGAPAPVPTGETPHLAVWQAAPLGGAAKADAEPAPVEPPRPGRATLDLSPPPIGRAALDLWGAPDLPAAPAEGPPAGNAIPVLVPVLFESAGPEAPPSPRDGRDEAPRGHARF